MSEVVSSVSAWLGKMSYSAAQKYWTQARRFSFFSTTMMATSTAATTPAIAVSTIATSTAEGMAELLA